MHPAVTFRPIEYSAIKKRSIWQQIIRDSESITLPGTDKLSVCFSFNNLKYTKSVAYFLVDPNLKNK